MMRRENRENLSEQQLLQLFEETSDLAYLGTIYHRNMHLIYGVCLKFLKERELAKDAVMDIFEKLTIKIKGQEIRDFGKWVYVVAKNHCLMQLRKKQITVNHEEIGHVFMESANELHPIEEDINANEIIQLERGLNNLAPEQRRCIQMFYFESKSYNEIVSETGYDIRNVKSYIQNGKRNLKIWMEKSGK